MKTFVISSMIFWRVYSSKNVVSELVHGWGDDVPDEWANKYAVEKKYDFRTLHFTS